MYAVSTAPWSVGFILLFLVTLAVGVALVAAAKPMLPVPPKPHQPPAWVFRGFGVLWISLVTAGAVQKWHLTESCLEAASTGAAETVQGRVESVSIEGKPTAPTYALYIAGKRYVSAGLGSSSECGFKQSLAQTWLPPVGAIVAGKAKGKVILELHVPE